MSSSMGFAPLTPTHGLKIPSLANFSEQAIGELKNFIQQVISGMSVTQIPGFSQFTAQAATTVTTSQTTTSTSPADLATVGPSLTDLPDGVYVFFWGSHIQTSATGVASYVGVKVNSTEPTTTEAIFGDIAGGFLPGFSFVQKTLSNGGANTAVLRYWMASAGTGTYRDRRLLALRVSN